MLRAKFGVCTAAGWEEKGACFPGGEEGLLAVAACGGKAPTITGDEMGQDGGRGTQGAAGGRGNSDRGRLSWHSAGLDTPWASCCQAAKERGKSKHLCPTDRWDWALGSSSTLLFLTETRSQLCPLFYRGNTALLPLQTGEGASGNMQHPSPNQRSTHMPVP